MVEVYDCDDATNIDDLSKQQLIGSHKFTLHDVVTQMNQELTADLINPAMKDCGKIKIRAQEKKSDYGQIQASFKLEAKLSSSDGSHFFVVNKQIDWTDEYRPVIKSECKKSDGGEFKWNCVHTDTDTLADNEPDHAVLIQVFKHSDSGDHERIASFTTTFGDIKGADKSLSVKSTDGKQDLKFKDISVKKKESFLDYIFGGCEIGL